MKYMPMPQGMLVVQQSALESVNESDDLAVGKYEDKLAIRTEL